jgi:hypothetical protein
MAVVITVTDWDDFKELEKHSEHKDPDFLLSGITDASIYTNMNPSMLISTRGEVKDITDDTKGIGLSGIITGGSNAGPIWSFRKLSGFSFISDMIKPKIEG